MPLFSIPHYLEVSLLLHINWKALGIEPGLSLWLRLLQIVWHTWSVLSFLKSM